MSLGGREQQVRAGPSGHRKEGVRGAGRGGHICLRGTGAPGFQRGWEGSGRTGMETRRPSGY